MFGLGFEFLLGAVAGGAVIYLFPGLGSGGSAIWNNIIKPFFKDMF